MPPFGSFANVAGRVVEANPAQHRVAVFIYVPGAGWWSKPFCDPQLTVIQANSSWSADITTGGADHLATRITALLVNTNYSEACVEGAAILPANVLAQALAMTTVERSDPSRRWIQFSGYDWWVKDSAGLVGPGPNYFSASTNNVWVDGAGQLHLRVTHRSNQWHCAEMVTQRSFGYGHYRFELASNVNQLNPNAVLGLFTWSDDPAWAHREIDVECSRWSNAGDIHNAQFVVQPWDLAGHLVRYVVPANQTNSAHGFIWESNRVTFQSQRGAFAAHPTPADVITNWTYNLTVPQPGDENVRINLWLFNGTAPAGGQEVEFVVKSFQFVPLGLPLPAVISGINRPPGSEVLLLTLNGHKDRRYRVEASTNLADWDVLQTVLATNSVFQVGVPSGAWPQCYFRAVTLP